jgi:hypothetical protein
MLRNGTARHSDSPWASPLQLVPKKEDGWRPCGSYHALNARIVHGKFPARHTADFAQLIAARRIFSTIDFVKAYHQIPVHADDIAKTATTTPYGISIFHIRSSGFERPRKHFSSSSMTFSETWISLMHISVRF